MPADPFHELRPDLERVERAIMEGFTGRDAPARDLAEYFVGRLGQLLRPGLVLAGAHALADPLPAAARDLGCLVELVHGASLLHDDVVDEADVRRGQATVFSSHGDRTSVLLGDLLLARALEFLAPHARPRVLASVAAVTRDLAAGQLLELEAEGRLDLPVEDYLEIIRLKTATFFGHCARIGGAAAGGADAELEALLTYGTSLGMAYQILDDLLDFASSEAAVGKPVGADLENARLTLPLVRLLERAEDRDRLVAGLEARDPAVLSEIRERVHSSGAFDAVVADARGYERGARQSLETLPESPRRAVLGDLLSYLFSRLAALTALDAVTSAAGS